MLIKSRLMVIKQVIFKYDPSVRFLFFPTVENKADRITRVPKRWLDRCESRDSGTEE